MSRKRRVLVVSPHPDDEALGCGGTLRKHVEEGDRVEVLFLSRGEGGGHGRDAGETRRVREREARRAARILGVHALAFWSEPDGRLAARGPLVTRLAAHLADTRPDIVYTTHPGEEHPDHRAAARLVCRAVRLSPGAAVLGFEVWTPVARADLLVDISPWIATKLRAIRAHASQCAVVPFAEAMEGLARYRGALHSWPGGPHAEAFRRLAGRLP